MTRKLNNKGEIVIFGAIVYFLLAGALITLDFTEGDGFEPVDRRGIPVELTSQCVGTGRC